MDNASDYGSEDSRFESWRARAFIDSFTEGSSERHHIRAAVPKLLFFLSAMTPATL